MAKLSEKHENIISHGLGKIEELRRKILTPLELKVDVENILLHRGKLLISVKDLNFGYDITRPIWKEAIDVNVYSGERIHLTGSNGCGKTTFIRLLTGELLPTSGEVFRADFTQVYLDQEYALVNSDLSMLELAQSYNAAHLLDHEVKLRLNRALFPQETWDKSCNCLSGGEKMRLVLCCLTLLNQVPDLIILDEPTNNLDLSSLSVLTRTICDYRGTLLVVSHDEHFVNQIGLNRSISISRE